MISIDTDALIQAAQAARSAASQLQTASELLNRITTHDDWGCRERVTINEYIQSSRNMMNHLEISVMSFMDIITQVAREFVEAECGISDMFEGVESLLGNILSTGAGTVSASPDIYSGVRLAKNITDGAYPGQTYPHVPDDINVVKFSDIANGIDCMK